MTALWIIAGVATYLVASCALAVVLGRAIHHHIQTPPEVHHYRHWTPARTWSSWIWAFPTLMGWRSAGNCGGPGTKCR